MKIHKGMRPQDVAILLKIATLNNPSWQNKDISNSLSISPSEVSEAIKRCTFAKLLGVSGRNIHINSLKEFLVYGLKYVFPVEPGAIVRGIPTAHSASPLNSRITSNSDIYVWQYDEGDFRGQQIEPLYKTIPKAALQDSRFYELLAIVDGLRVGRAREIAIAIEELDRRLNYE
ncbi:MAG: hypothetical protein PHE56_13135 [Bacteroidales bacterium]|nr:hypothetical protein [Bacteroidales bacterium]